MEKLKIGSKFCRQIMFQKEEEPPHSESYQGLVPVVSSAETYRLVSSPLPPLSRFSFSFNPHIKFHSDWYQKFLIFFYPQY